MSRLRAAILVVCLVAPSAARAADGSVHLYLQPLPQEAARLSFTLASVSAVAAGGSEYPLQLRLKTVRQPEGSRQRLLASGRLPPGSYAGFLFKVGRAAVKGAQGETSLAVPDAPVRLDVPFSVGGEQAPFFWLALRHQESVAGDAGFSPVFSALVPPSPIVARAGFVSSARSNTITVFDKSLGQAVGAIDTCAAPAGMALDQRRRRLLVACPRDDEVHAIDVATGRLIERSRLSPGDRPREVALAPDGSAFVTVNNGSNSISFFDAASLARQERVAVGSGPGSILFDPAGRRAFVFNTLSSSISIVDVSNRTVSATVSTDSAPLRGQFDARGDRLYVIHERSPYMTVLDPRQLTAATRARLRIGVTAIEVDKVRGLVCVGGDDGVVEFYDPNALMPIYAMRTGGDASHMRMDVEDNLLYIVSPGTRSLLVGRLRDRKVATEIDVGESPGWVAVMGEK